MTGLKALEELMNGSKIYRGYFKEEADDWFIVYDKNNKSFNVGPGWNDALKFRSNEQIMSFILYCLFHDEWKVLD